MSGRVSPTTEKQGLSPRLSSRHPRSHLPLFGDIGHEASAWALRALQLLPVTEATLARAVRPDHVALTYQVTGDVHAANERVAAEEAVAAFSAAHALVPC